MKNNKNEKSNKNAILYKDMLVEEVLEDISLQHKTMLELLKETIADHVDQANNRTVKQLERIISLSNDYALQPFYEKLGKSLFFWVGGGVLLAYTILIMGLSFMGAKQFFMDFETQEAVKLMKTLKERELVTSFWSCRGKMAEVIENPKTKKKHCSILMPYMKEASKTEIAFFLESTKNP